MDILQKWSKEGFPAELGLTETQINTLISFSQHPDCGYKELASITENGKGKK